MINLIRRECRSAAQKVSHNRYYVKLELGEKGMKSLVSCFPTSEDVQRRYYIGA